MPRPCGNRTGCSGGTESQGLGWLEGKVCLGELRTGAGVGTVSGGGGRARTTGRPLLPQAETHSHAFRPLLHPRPISISLHKANVPGVVNRKPCKGRGEGGHESRTRQALGRRTAFQSSGFQKKEKEGSRTFATLATNTAAHTAMPGTGLPPKSRPGARGDQVGFPREPRAGARLTHSCSGRRFRCWGWARETSRSQVSECDPGS